jgi:DNA-directed RNA polymerase specialized sigma24 family protein
MTADGREDLLKSLVARHGRRLFALALYLVGGDKDKAYDAAASGCAEALRRNASPERGGALVRDLAASVLSKCRAVRALPRFNEEDFQDLAPDEREALRRVAAALHALDFDARALILLRDQLLFAYRDIAALIGCSEPEARRRMVEARADLRKKVVEAARHGA